MPKRTLAIVARRALIAAILFYGLAILFVGFVRVEPITGIADTLMKPADWLVYTWAPMHDMWAFILANVVNFSLYFVLFAVIFGLLGRPSGAATP